MNTLVTQSRWNSLITWAAVAAAILLVLQAAGFITVAQAEELKLAINAVLVALVGLGVLNNGTNPVGYGANPIPAGYKLVPINTPEPEKPPEV